MNIIGVVTPAQPGRPTHALSVGIEKPDSPLADYFYGYDGSLTERWPNGVCQESHLDLIKVAKTCVENRTAEIHQMS